MIDRLALLVAAMFVAAACTSSTGDTIDAGGGGDSATAESSSTTADLAPAESTTTTTTEAEATSTADGPADGEANLVAGALPVDPSWEELPERWFVWGVAEDDTLNVRSGPGTGNEILTTLAPNQAELTRYGEVVWVGETRWAPVAIPGGAGWVSLEFLKPNPSVETPVVEGTSAIDEARLEAVLATINDPAALAEFVGSEGLTLAPYQFVDDETVVLSADELRTTADQTRVWGEADGEGGPISLTLQEFLDQVAGNTGLTSTELIGYDTVVSSGNVINNLSTAFFGANWAEYYFGGTEYYGRLDWESVTFVFDPDGTLLAIAIGEWTV